MTEREKHAVVLGAGIAGLFAAKVLADFYDTVTVIERDTLPDEPVSRRGVPQSKHAHVLLARLSQITEQIFPGLLDQLVDDGVTCWDDGDISKIGISYSGNWLVGSGQLPSGTSSPIYYASRPFFEWHVRRQVRDVENVTFLENRDVVNLTSTRDHHRVTGVRIASRDDGVETALHADLVVDTTGRGSRTPVFLEELGYGKVREDEVPVGVVYCSQRLRMKPGSIHENFIAVFPQPGRPTIFGLVRYENDEWGFGVSAMAGLEGARDRAEMLQKAAEFAPEHAVEAASAAEVLNDPARYRLPGYRWRRYDKLRRNPQGLVVLGDAVAVLNPIYGQGMTIAAIEALILRDSLSGDRRGDWPRRFYRDCAKAIRVAWQMSVSSDLAMPELNLPRSLPMRISGAGSKFVLNAVQTDLVVADQFMRVSGMIDSPLRLLRPSIASRIVKAYVASRSAASRASSTGGRVESSQRWQPATAEPNGDHSTTKREEAHL